MNSRFACATADAVNLPTLAFDLAVWAAGYEARSEWLVRSPFRPGSVDEWMKVEFEEDRHVHSAPRTLALDLGRLVGGRPGKRNWDGYWMATWSEELHVASRRRNRRLDVFVDYSSMPRTVYGTLIMACLRSQAVRSLTLSYTPGHYGSEVDGARRLDGLRPLVGLEGRSVHDREPAFVVGLGYDGALTRALMEVFQVGHFSVYWGDPGVTSDGAGRARAINAGILERAERHATAPAWSIGDSYVVAATLCDWYLPRRDVMLVPLGPKPHVIGGLLVAAMQPRVGFRWIKTGQSRPVEVKVPSAATPFVETIQL
jgi:hypothetical protein